MAQRVFLVQIPKHALATAAAAICDPNPGTRGDVAATLAMSGEAHLARVAASAMVIDAAERAGASDADYAWGFARNCMPFLLSATKADAMIAKLEQVSRIDDPEGLESFFVEEVRALGKRVDDLRREAFRPPDIERLRAWIAEQLEDAAKLHASALAADAGDDAIEDYAISVWIWIGRIFAQTRPCFWQAKNRWLGGAAVPDVFENHTRTITIRGRDKTVEVSTEVQPAQPELAPYRVPSIDALLTSTAELAPSLGVAGWEVHLPKCGGGNLVSGGVRHERLDDLVRTMRRLHELDDPPYGGGDWVELVVAAAELAKKANAHLVEGDDVLTISRWPAL